MNKKIRKIFLVLAITFCFLYAVGNKTYAKYVLTRNFDVAVTSAPFHFNAEQVESQIVFPRTADEADTDIILTEETTFHLRLTNQENGSVNPYDISYEIAIVNSSKFTFAEGDTIEGTLAGTVAKEEEIPITLKIKNLEDPTNHVTIRVTSKSPYQKTIEFNYPVVQEGAIQTIEDLLDLSLAVRDTIKGRNHKTSAEVITQRWKMTRDLDFEDKTKYENADRTDYGDINLNDVAAANLFEELTSETGFLPIGMLEYPFQGTFNGGGHTISNMRIHKSLQVSIGLFGNTTNATIKNFHVSSSDVYNENQTAGMVIGKMVGGLIENVIVDGDSVMSVDTVHTSEDTYSGGVVGFMELNATARNCENHASVRTEFTGATASYSGPAGGITAWMANSTIENCKNYGTVVGQSYVGGIAGFANMQDAKATAGGGTIKNCENYGEVKTYVTTQTGGLHIGGIAGYNKANGIIESCTNQKDAKVSGKQNIGGIVGNNMGTVRNNENFSSSITGNSNVHGIIGRNSGTDGGGNVDHAGI